MDDFRSLIYPKRPMNSAIPPGNFETLSGLNELDLTRLFFLKLNNSLGQVVIKSKKSQHKSNLIRRESISKLPGGMALLVGHLKKRFCFRV